MHHPRVPGLLPPRLPCPRTSDHSVRKLVIVSCVMAAVALSAVVVAVKQVGTSTTTAVVLPPSAPPTTTPTTTPATPAPTRAARPSRGEARPALLPKSAPRSPKVVETGACEASFYGEGQATASGEAFNPAELTAAHKTLPFGSKVQVTNKENDESVIVRINDRGPFVSGRCLDLSTAAMKAVGGVGSGVIQVTYEVLAA
jgi:rare lipoprotein A